MAGQRIPSFCLDIFKVQIKARDDQNYVEPSNKTSDLGEEKVLLGSHSFVKRSFHMTLLNVSRLVRSVEITHALDCGVLL
jgi:hypothetical protein